MEIKFHPGFSLTTVMTPLLAEKHEKYFRLCLQSFPAKAQLEDSNKLALIYFCLHGLGLLDKLDFSAEERDQYANFLYEHVISTADTSIQAFRPSQTFALAAPGNGYDLPNLSATLFGLCNLLALQNDYLRRLDRHKIMAFVSRCQVKEEGPLLGAFRPVLDVSGAPFGEIDLRHCYIAASIRKLVKYDELSSAERTSDIDVEALIGFIRAKIAVTGGLSSSDYTEPHSGLTFCGLAALQLLGVDFSDAENAPWVNVTKEWLVHRQVDYPTSVYTDDYQYYDPEDIGGFNGRENKFADTCYCWWVSGSLALLDPGKGLLLANLEAASGYLLDHTQHAMVGGFSKDGEAFPDPFHSFLGLASLALWLQFTGNEMGLDEVDPALVITGKLRRFLDEMVFEA